MTLRLSQPLDPSTTMATHDLYVFDEYGLAHPLACAYKTFDLPNPNDYDGGHRPFGLTTEEAVINAVKDLAEYRLDYPQYRFKAKVMTIVWDANYDEHVTTHLDTDDLEAVGNLLMEDEVQHDLAA